MKTRCFFILYIVIVWMYGCKERQHADKVDFFEPKSDIDTSYKHFLFLTGGYFSDSVILFINDSVFFSGIVTTDERLGSAKVIQTNIEQIRRLSIKLINNNKIFMDTTYAPKSNSKCFTVRKDSLFFDIDEAQNFPRFQ